MRWQSLVGAAVVALAAGPGGGARAQEADSTHARDRYVAATEARLDSLYGPLLYLMQPDERGVYPALPVSGKRDYLRRFWARRDPSPGTPQNELEDEFYARLAAANRKFRESGLVGSGDAVAGGAAGGATHVSGWRTDRGRIYIEHGPPDQVLLRPHPPGTLPYEVWKYTRRKPAKYCFVDLTRFGNYVLVWSDDPQERTGANWRQLLGKEAYEEVMRF